MISSTIAPVRNAVSSPCWNQIMYFAVPTRPAARPPNAGDDAGDDAAARGLRMAQPPEREDEERSRREVGQLCAAVDHRFGSRSRNIFSIRSVIRKPLTMFVIDAATA